MGNPALSESPETAQLSPVAPVSPQPLSLHTREVAGSIPAAPILKGPGNGAFSLGAGIVPGIRGEASVETFWKLARGMSHESTRIRTAYHEAGHAVAAGLLGLGVKWVTIEPGKGE
jgi:hypothetical protein